MNSVLRNKWPTTAVLILFTALHAFNVACELGYCYCPKVLNHTSSKGHGSDHHDKPERHDHETDHHNSDTEHNKGCCPDQHCCDSVSDTYLVKKATEVNVVTKGDASTGVIIISHVVPAYSRHVYSNRWIKCVALKYPPQINYNIRVFIQSFLN